MISLPFIESAKKVIVNPLITLLITAAFAYFLWGVVEFIQGATVPAERSKGARHIFFGIIGLVIMFTVFGIMNAICATIGC